MDQMGSHLLPVEQGRLARQGVPRRLGSCTCSLSGALIDERHCVSRALKLMASSTDICWTSSFDELKWKVLTALLWMDRLSAARHCIAMYILVSAAAGVSVAVIMLDCCSLQCFVQYLVLVCGLVLVIVSESKRP